MKDERKKLLETVVASIVKEGGSLPELLEVVYQSAVSSALLVHYGNQTKAAIQLEMHRNVLRRYNNGGRPRKGAQYDRDQHAKTKKRRGQG